LPLYLDKLSEIAPPFYKQWGELLHHALLAEASATGRQETLPLHLRESQALADPRAEGLDGFLQTLLSPARCGIILTRADLTRAARTLNLGTRIGERRYILNALFGQDAPGMLGWLTQEASRWAKRHHARRDTLGAIAAAWEARAEAAAALLSELKRTANEAA
jgi:hypothetical protein